MKERRLLEGIRILDCASWIAGPAAATIAADFGAEVIKIEPPGVGDSYRNKFSNVYYAPKNCYDYTWFVDSRNKTSLTLDLKSDEGQEIFTKLVRTADVVLTNMPIRSRKRLKLTYEDIKSIKSDIIFASMTPFGEEGPYADDKAFDSTSFWARSGLMDSLRGRHDRMRRNLPGQGDHPTAMTLFAGIMLALYDRERTGEGRQISTSLLHNGIWTNALAVQGGSTLEWFDSPSWDEGLVKIMRSAYYFTADNHCVMLDMINSDEEFERLFELLGVKDNIYNHPLYKPLKREGPEVWEDEVGLIDIVQDGISKWKQKELLEVAHKNNITLVWVNRNHEVKNDPQVIANNMLINLDPDMFETDIIVDSPLRLSGAKKEIRLPAPELGMHTNEILESIGYSQETIAMLRDKGVV